MPALDHSRERSTISLDIVGAAASLVCAVHCMGVALVLGLVPALEIVAQPWVEWLFLGASTLLGVTALVPGYRQHRHPMPLVLFIGGIAILFAARLLRLPSSTLELSIVLPAAAALIAAHWRNRDELRACRRSRLVGTDVLPTT
jgi:hypothetical protein